MKRRSAFSTCCNINMQLKIMNNDFVPSPHFPPLPLHPPLLHWLSLRRKGPGIHTLRSLRPALNVAWTYWRSSRCAGLRWPLRRGKWLPTQARPDSTLRWPCRAYVNQRLLAPFFSPLVPFPLHSDSNTPSSRGHGRTRRRVVYRVNNYLLLLVINYNCL